MSQPGVKSSASVRSQLCHQIADALNQGTNHVRIRIRQQAERPVEASLLAHQKNQWHEKQANLASAGDLTALVGDMNLVASQGHTDELTVRQTTRAEAIDTDLQFQNAWLEGHRGDNLASCIEGVLFRSSHASGQDMRRQIRTPHRGA